MGYEIVSKIIRILDLVFKPETDYIRESPVLIIISELVKKVTGIEL